MAIPILFLFVMLVQIRIQVKIPEISRKTKRPLKLYL